MSRQIFDVGERLLLSPLPTFEMGRLGRQEFSVTGAVPAAAHPLGRVVKVIQASG